MMTPQTELKLEKKRSVRGRGMRVGGVRGGKSYDVDLEWRNGGVE